MSVHTLTNKKDIARVFSKGKGISDTNMLFKIVPNEYGYMRFLLCVPKKLKHGNKKIHKPMKNTQLRRMRVIIRTEQKTITQSVDIACVFKKADVNFKELQRSFVFLIQGFLKKRINTNKHE